MVRVTGQRPSVSGHWQGVTELIITDQRSRPWISGYGSRITGQQAQVKVHVSRISRQGSWSRVTGQRSPVRGHWSVVNGQRSGVTGQSQELLVKDHWSVVKGHLSNHFLSSDLIRIRFSRRFGSYDILKTINFQVRDLHLQAMGVGWGDPAKNFRLISNIRPYMNMIHPRVGK